MVPIHACIFDLYGTLVPSVQVDAYDGALRQVARALGLEEEQFLRGWRATSREREVGAHPTHASSVCAICTRLGVTLDEAHIDRCLKPFQCLIADAMVPKPESAVVLAELRRRSFPLGLISNCGPSTPGLFTQGPLAPFFQEMIFSSREGLAKPDPEIYRIMTRRLGAAPGECLYIGDGHGRELAGAAAVGMTTVLVEYDPAGVLIRDRDEDAHYRIRDLRELLPFLPAVGAAFSPRQADSQDRLGPPKAAQ